MDPTEPDKKSAIDELVNQQFKKLYPNKEVSGSMKKKLQQIFSGYEALLSKKMQNSPEALETIKKLDVQINKLRQENESLRMTIKNMEDSFSRFESDQDQTLRTIENEHTQLRRQYEQLRKQHDELLHKFSIEQQQWREIKEVNERMAQQRQIEDSSPREEKNLTSSEIENDSVIQADMASLDDPIRTSGQFMVPEIVSPSIEPEVDTRQKHVQVQTFECHDNSSQIENFAFQSQPETQRNKDLEERLLFSHRQQQRLREKLFQEEKLNNKFRQETENYQQAISRLETDLQLMQGDIRRLRDQLLNANKELDNSQANATRLYNRKNFYKQRCQELQQNLSEQANTYLHMLQMSEERHLKEMASPDSLHLSSSKMDSPLQRLRDQNLMDSVKKFETDIIHQVEEEDTAREGTARFANTNKPKEQSPPPRKNKLKMNRTVGINISVTPKSSKRESENEEYKTPGQSGQSSPNILSPKTSEKRRKTIKYGFSKLQEIKINKQMQQVNRSEKYSQTQKEPEDQVLRSKTSQNLLPNYNLLRNQKEQLQKMWMQQSKQLQDLKNELEIMKLELVKREQKLSLVEQQQIEQLTRKDEQLEYYRDFMGRLSESNTAFKSQVQSLQQQNTTLHQQMTNLKDQIMQFNEEIQNLKRDNHNNLEVSKRSAQQLNRLNGDKQRLTIEINNITDKCIVLTKLNEETKAANTKLQLQIGFTKLYVQKLKDQNHHLKTQMRKTTIQRESQTDKHQTADIETQSETILPQSRMLNEYQSPIKQIQNKLSTVVPETIVQVQEKSRVSQQISQLKRQNEQLSSRVSQQNTRYNEQLNEMKKINESLKTEISQLSEQNSKTSRLIESMTIMQNRTVFLQTQLEKSSQEIRRLSNELMRTSLNMEEKESKLKMLEMGQLENIRIAQLETLLDLQRQKTDKLILKIKVQDQQICNSEEFKMKMRIKMKHVAENMKILKAQRDTFKLIFKAYQNTNQQKQQERIRRNVKMIEQFQIKYEKLVQQNQQTIKLNKDKLLKTQKSLKLEQDMRKLMTSIDVNSKMQGELDALRKAQQNSNKIIIILEDIVQKVIEKSTFPKKAGSMERIRNLKNARPVDKLSQAGDLLIEVSEHTGLAVRPEMLPKRK